MCSGNSVNLFTAMGTVLTLSLPYIPRSQTPRVAFRHLPPNSARIGYATEEALFISAQLSTEAVSALRKVWVLIRLWKQHSAPPSLISLMVSVDVKHHVYLLDIAPKHAREHETRPLRVKKKKVRLHSNDFGFICAGVSNVISYKRNV